MLELNRILIQLNKASELSNSSLPPEQNLAIILLDNLFEVQLYKKAEVMFQLDETTWYSGKRQFDKSKRLKSRQNYDQLLKISKDAKIITEQELELLQFAHGIRNTVYHRGEDVDKKYQIVLLIYYSLLKSNAKIFKSSWGVGYTDSPGYEKIDFGQGLEKIDNRDTEAYINSFFNSGEYFDKAFAFMLNRFNPSHNLTELARHYLMEQIEDIKWRLNFIMTECKWVNFYGAMVRYWYLNPFFHEQASKKIKPKGIDSILLILMFLRLHKDDLDDIDDLKLRQKQGLKAYKLFRQIYKGVYPHHTDLDALLKRLTSLPKNNDHKVIKTVIEIQIKISNLYTDSEAAAFELDGHIQHLSDLAREK